METSPITLFTPMPHYAANIDLTQLSSYLGIRQIGSGWDAVLGKQENHHTVVVHGDYVVKYGPKVRIEEGITLRHLERLKVPAPRLYAMYKASISEQRGWAITDQYRYVEPRSYPGFRFALNLYLSSVSIKFPLPILEHPLKLYHTVCRRTTSYSSSWSESPALTSRYNGH
jgi:hypothetical protein